MPLLGTRYDLCSEANSLLCMTLMTRRIIVTAEAATYPYSIGVSNAASIDVFGDTDQPPWKRSQSANILLLMCEVERGPPETQQMHNEALTPIKIYYTMSSNIGTSRRISEVCSWRDTFNDFLAFIYMCLRERRVRLSFTET